MFPLNWNIPFIRKNGSRTTLGAITGDIAGIEEDVTELTDKAEGLWDNMMDNGAVNILSYPYNNTTKTTSGITYTDNGDGTISANDTSTALATFSVATGLHISKATKITGCPSGGADGKYAIEVYNSTKNTRIGFDTGNGLIIPAQDAADNIAINIQIWIGQTISNLVFKPMLSDPSLNLSYDDYVPYAKTNREVTEELAITDHWAESKVSGVSYFSGSYLKKYGHIVTLSFSVSDELPASTDTKVLELPAGCRPAGNFIVPAYINGVVNGHAWIRANGDVEIRPDTAGTYLGFTITYIATQ